MSTISKLQIAELLTDVVGHRYFIIETYMTSDGMRSRICSERYQKRDTAERALQSREQLIKAYHANKKD